ncbi:RING finger protein 11-like isoform X2 [Tachypleus tridentatus]|uniref:RING finger protein 11-like isoform X2 n=1 Tax=Tachypleus tridentatus TaxID=6853 RepID=UPI003FD565EB
MGNCNCLKSLSSDDVSLLRENSSVSSTEQLGPPPYQESEPVPVYYPSPNVSRPASQLTEEEQIQIAKRIGLIQHIPSGLFDGSKKNREWTVLKTACLVMWNDSIVSNCYKFLQTLNSTVLY